MHGRPIGILATILLGVAAVGPAHGACPTPQAVLHDSEWIVTNPDWTPGLYYQSSPATSPALAGFWWALTGGDPAIGAGNDNGASAVTFEVEPAFADYQGYLGYYFPYVMNAGLPFNWGYSLVDGCVTSTGPPAEQCTCLLLGDAWSGAGSYLVTSGAYDAGSFHVETGDADYGMGHGDMILSPVPRPVMVGSSVAGGRHLLSVMTATGPDPIDDHDPCGCLLGYKVYLQARPIGSPPPTGRAIAEWTEASAGNGGLQPITPLGDVATVGIDCPPDPIYVWLATALVFDSGYVTPYVSANSMTLGVCAEILAQPSRPERPGAASERERPRGRARRER